MDIVKLSASMIVLALCLYFVFKYIAYFAKSMFRDIKLRNIMQNSGKTSISDDEVNLTVANNVISILVWGIFTIVLFVIKVTKDGGDIDAITASTITSRAYSLAVSNAVAFVKSIVKAEED